MQKIAWRYPTISPWNGRTPLQKRGIPRNSFFSARKKRLSLPVFHALSVNQNVYQGLPLGRELNARDYNSYYLKDRLLGQYFDSTLDIQNWKTNRNQLQPITLQQLLVKADSPHFYYTGSAKDHAHHDVAYLMQRTESTYFVTMRNYQLCQLQWSARHLAAQLPRNLGSSRDPFF